MIFSSSQTFCGGGNLKNIAIKKQGPPNVHESESGHRLQYFVVFSVLNRPLSTIGFRPRCKEKFVVGKWGRNKKLYLTQSTVYRILIWKSTEELLKRTARTGTLIKTGRRTAWEFISKENLFLIQWHGRTPCLWNVNRHQTTPTLETSADPVRGR